MATPERTPERTPDHAPDHAPARAPGWDEQIQWRLLRGEETALGELYDRYAPLVHGLAGRILDDPAAAEQLTREIFAHLWQHPEAFDPSAGSLRSWIGSLTHRRAVDRLRHQRADDGEIAARATAARIQYVVTALPEPLRQAIAVGYYDGLSYQDTAHRLGISEQAAKERMRAGLRQLAAGLESAGIEPTAPDTVGPDSRTAPLADGEAAR